MLIFVVLLVAAAVVVGFYGHQNGGTHDVSLFNWSWSGVDAWVPVAVTAAGVGLLALLAILYGSARIGRLRRQNLALRAELEELHRGPAALPAADRHADREVVGRRAGLRGWFARRRSGAPVEPVEAAPASGAAAGPPYDRATREELAREERATREDLLR